jgi:DNA-directed RNA polymerase specialized sigma24 family protein
MKSALSLKECLFLNRIYGMSASFRRIANAVAYPSPPASAPSSGPEIGGDLLVIQPELRDRLMGLVRRLCHDPNLHEDVLQETLLCYWRTELARPGQTASWYEQRCRFWIQDYFKKGRSVDSPKHSSSCCSMHELGEPEMVAHADVLQEVCERDLFDVLLGRLDPPRQEVLRLLRKGLGLREMARDLGLSHVAVLGHRREIAELCRALQP